MKIIIIDTYYPDFVKSLPHPVNGSYDTELRKVLDRAFGTADFYSHYLTKEGWECRDVIANHERLQHRWTLEATGLRGGSMRATALEQIEAWKPDVVFLQDLSFFSAADLELIRKRYLLAGQCSCPMPRRENVEKFHILFTSFPHYVDQFRSLGVQAHYLPLAFDPRMLSEESTKKQFDITFVGGVGKQSHWNYGTNVLEAVAKAFPDQFRWWGYGVENLGPASPLRGCYAGQAWGREVYSIYGRSKVVINRHGEVAEGYSNNLRMYEATGMGAYLVTEDSLNIHTLFSASMYVGYEAGNNSEVVSILSDLLSRWDRYSPDAKQTQQHTLLHHTYAHRMKVVSEILQHVLEKTAA